MRHLWQLLNGCGRYDGRPGLGRAVIPHKRCACNKLLASIYNRMAPAVRASLLKACSILLACSVLGRAARAQDAPAFDPQSLAPVLEQAALIVRGATALI